MRPTYIFLLFSFSIGLLNNCSQEKRSISKFYWLPFTWYGDSVNGQWKDKLAILIPFHWENEDYTFQADLGADISLLYGVPFYYLGGKAEGDTITPNKRKWKYTYLKGKIDTVQMLIPFYIMDDYGDTEQVSASSKIKNIGTLGMDFFRKKNILVFDYKNSRWAQADSISQLPDSLSKKINWSNMRYYKEAIYLPMQFQDSTYDLVYDSGNGDKILITSKYLWKKITGKNGNEKDNIYETAFSWGENITLVGDTAFGKSINIAGNKFENPVVFYDMTDSLLTNSHNKERAKGYTGNASFYNKIVIFDFQKNKFGTINE